MLKWEEFPKLDSEKSSVKARGEAILQSMLCNNLILVFSSARTIHGDIAKIKEALEASFKYARHSLLWIVHRDGESQVKPS